MRQSCYACYTSICVYRVILLRILCFYRVILLYEYMRLSCYLAKSIHVFIVLCLLKPCLCLVIIDESIGHPFTLHILMICFHHWYAFIIGMLSLCYAYSHRLILHDNKSLRRYLLMSCYVCKEYVLNTLCL